MRNSLICILISLLLLVAIYIGHVRDEASKSAVGCVNAVPHIGRIQVLNGCGQGDAAKKVKDFLQEKSFDVAISGNAKTWNYPFTMVISRISDMSIARQVAQALHTDKVVLVRTTDTLYNVTVVLGPDYGERIH